jgi:hypothetical protein
MKEGAQVTLNIAAKVVRVKDRPDVLEAMAGEGRNLRQRLATEHGPHEDFSVQLWLWGCIFS